MAKNQNDLSSYLRELSELGRKFGYGLEGIIQIYEFQQDDFLFSYVEDADGFLRLGNADADPASWSGRNSKSGIHADARSDVSKKDFWVA